MTLIMEFCPGGILDGPRIVWFQMSSYNKIVQLAIWKITTKETFEFILFTFLYSFTPTVGIYGTGLYKKMILILPVLSQCRYSLLLALLLLE